MNHLGRQESFGNTMVGGKDHMFTMENEDFFGDSNHKRRASATTMNPKHKNQIRMAIGGTPGTGMSEREIVIKS